jgi:putative ABC transport system ATP-binding protein
MTAAMTIEGLTLYRGGLTVLQDISLQVNTGEVLVLMGASGSGKSSLLRCLNRLEEPQAGRILLGDTPIADLDVIELRRRVGMIFQKTAPFPGTVADNVRYGPTLRGEAIPPDRVAALLDAAALERDLADRPAQALSSGQEQRLAIARALANQPDVLLLDEPTSALDPIATHAVEDTILRLRDDLNLTVVWVSHSAEQARRVGDRLILLEEGRIIREGTMDNLLNETTGDDYVLAFAAGQDLNHQPPE